MGVDNHKNIQKEECKSDNSQWLLIIQNEDREGQMDHDCSAVLITVRGTVVHS